MKARRIIMFWAGLSSLLLAAGASHAAATVSCPFQGKVVRVVIANSKDIPRSCNAVCVWAYANAQVALRGAGGAALELGESRTVYNSVAPYPVNGVVTSEINCNR